MLEQVLVDCGVSVIRLQEFVKFPQLVPGSNKVGAIVAMDDMWASSKRRSPPRNAAVVRSEITSRWMALVDRHTNRQR